MFYKAMQNDIKVCIYTIAPLNRLDTVSMFTMVRRKYISHTTFPLSPNSINRMKKSFQHILVKIFSTEGWDRPNSGLKCFRESTLLWERISNHPGTDIFRIRLTTHSPCSVSLSSRACIDQTTFDSGILDDWGVRILCSLVHTQTRCKRQHSTDVNVVAANQGSLVFTRGGKGVFLASVKILGN